MQRKQPAYSWRILCIFSALLILALTPACAWLSPGGVGKQTALTGYQHFNMAMSYRAEGQMDMAAAELEKALAADKYNYAAWYHLGLAYKDLGKIDSARQTWEKGIVTARRGPIRSDYDRSRAIAEMTAALAGLNGRGPIGRPLAPPPKARAKTKYKSKAKAARRTAPRTGSYAVLYSSNLNPRNASKDRDKLIRLGYQAIVKTHNLRGKVWHRVWVGCCTGYTQARGTMAALRKRGIGRDLVVMRVSR
jgi:tetratricopeptide (TPR) repeat protein